MNMEQLTTYKWLKIVQTNPTTAEVLHQLLFSNIFQGIVNGMDTRHLSSWIYSKNSAMKCTSL